MKVLHVCFADGREGGAIGAYRLHRAMLGEGVDSHMLVVHKTTDDPSVLAFSSPRKIVNRVNRALSAGILKLQSSDNLGVRSLNIFPTGTHRLINKFNADVVQLHWINRNTISIGEIAKINKPVFWKLPDMWAFSGTEHYLNPGDKPRYKEGYYPANRQEGVRGLDLDQMLWRYKARCWSKANFTVVCPSKWLAKCARESFLFRDRPVYNIANPIDLEVYKPAVDKSRAKREFGLSSNKKTVLFGSLRAMMDRRKGFHHLQKAIARLADIEDTSKLELAILGESGPQGSTLYGMTVRYLGSFHEDERLVMAYTAADVVVLPAEIDNLPNTVQEATACGVPCVAFDTGGLPDMITHKKTGYLARPFDEMDLAQGIKWVLEQTAKEMSQQVRTSAANLHSPSGRVSDYLAMYRGRLEKNQ